MKKLSLTLLITALTLALCGRSAAQEQDLATAFEAVESDEGWRRGESHTESFRNEQALLFGDEPIVEHSAAEDEAEDEDEAEEWPVDEAEAEMAARR